MLRTSKDIQNGFHSIINDIEHEPNEGCIMLTDRRSEEYTTVKSILSVLLVILSGGTLASLRPSGSMRKMH
jgi:hypothetical protein